MITRYVFGQFRAKLQYIMIGDLALSNKIEDFEAWFKELEELTKDGLF